MDRLYLKTIKAVWLSRQHQLQDMVIENYAPSWGLAIAFSNVLMGVKMELKETLEFMKDPSRFAKLKKRLKRNTLGGRIAGLETDDKMTDRQIAAKVRKGSTFRRRRLAQ